MSKTAITQLAAASEMSVLTEKQKLFCQEYVVDLDAKSAAIRAGYSAKSARHMSYYFSNHPLIMQCINTLLEQAQTARIASAIEVMEYLTAILRGEEVEEVTVVEGIGDGYSAARNVMKSVSPKDKLKAAELLGKRYGLFNDKLDVASSISITVDHDYGPALPEHEADYEIPAADDYDALPPCDPDFEGVEDYGELLD